MGGYKNNFANFLFKHLKIAATQSLISNLQYHNSVYLKKLSFSLHKNLFLSDLETSERSDLEKIASRIEVDDVVSSPFLSFLC